MHREKISAIGGTHEGRWEVMKQRSVELMKLIQIDDGLV
jgi:hypothetical protein